MEHSHLTKNLIAKGVPDKTLRIYFVGKDAPAWVEITGTDAASWRDIAIAARDHLNNVIRDGGPPWLTPRAIDKRPSPSASRTAPA